MFCVISSFAQDGDKNLLDSVQKVLREANPRDSLTIANSHYNLGEIYRYGGILRDSAYYHYHQAEKIFKKLNDKYKLARTFYGIAVVQKDDKDFTGSELNSIQAISLLDQLSQTNDVKKYKAFCYNNLGLAYDLLEQPEEAISYFKKALEIKEKLKGDNKRTVYTSKANLGFAYKNAGQFEQSTQIYEDLFKDKDLRKEMPGLYATSLDNYGHALYLSKNFRELPSLYYKALSVCDSLGNTDGIYRSIIINRHIAEYYYDRHIIDSAKVYAYRAKDISEEYYNDDLLQSLLFLSKIEKGETAAKHLREYVRLSDSLQKNERKIRDKYARIQYETEQVEQKNIQYARERLWLTIVSIILLISAMLIYVIISQRAKNNELKFVQKQQEANEEIYNLMLNQQERIEEARTLEKKTISQELHDGILGRLFGTRLSLDSLNMASSEEAVNTRGRYIQDLKRIEEDIRKVSHELNTDFISGSGFLDIIKTLLETQTKAYDLDYEFNHNDSINWEDLSNKNKIHIYRIIQETLHNIYKHANASLVKIGIQLKNNLILLTINDDGSGFDVNKAKAGIGLKNINSRVKEINGEIDITSGKDIGTTVKIKVPI